METRSKIPGTVLVVSAVFLLASCVGVVPRSGIERAGHYYCRVVALPPHPEKPSEPEAFLGVYLSGTGTYTADRGASCGRGVRIAGVIPGTGADEAGFLKGDLIVGIDGGSVCTDEGTDPVPVVLEKIRSYPPETTVRVEFVRDRKVLRRDVSLHARPVFSPPVAEYPGLLDCPTGVSLLDGTLPDDRRRAFYDVEAGIRARTGLLHNAKWYGDDTRNPFQSPDVTFGLRHPLGLLPHAEQLSGRVEKKVQPGTFPELTALLLDAAEMGGFLPETPASPGPERAAGPNILERLIKTVGASGDRIRRVVDSLQDGQAELLRGEAPALWEGEAWNRILEIAQKIDRRELVGAAADVTAMLTSEALAGLFDELSVRYGDPEVSPVVVDSPVGRIYVGGPGPDVYRDDAAIIMDLGGDDIYLNNAGGSRPGVPVALVIDWGGNDRYLARAAGSQGTGILGAGILLDLGGDDLFSGLDATQGTGIFGVGLLVHRGGEAVLEARRFAQGTGMFGIGIAVTGRGATIYQGGGWGQGLGLPGGVGILVDPAGADRYFLGGLVADHRDPDRATVSMGQGFGKGLRSDEEIDGVSGGIGLLVDFQGDDLYRADYFAQGAGYYYGLGILDDHAGADRYVAGRYAQGAGIHTAGGVLLDRRGNDGYTLTYGVGQGMGHDFGVGILNDRGGRDSADGGVLVQGASTRGAVGMLVHTGERLTGTYGGSSAGSSKDVPGAAVLIGEGRVVRLDVKARGEPE